MENSFPIVKRINSLLHAARFVQNPIPVVESNMAEFGPSYFFHMGGKRLGLITQDLEVMQHILQRNHKNYNKSPLQSKELASYIGHGLLTNNGEDWLRQRRLIQPAFSRKNVNSLADLMGDELKKVFEREIGEGGHINMSHLAAMLTFHIISRAIFSDEVDEKQILQMRDNVERVQKMIVLQVRQPYKKWYYNISGKIRRHKKLAQNSRNILKGLIQKRKDSGIQKGDLLQFLLETRYEDSGQSMTIEQLVDEVLILMVAGHETTAHCLTWTLLLLNRHKDVKSRLLTDIHDRGTDYLSYFEGDSYLMAVIKESLRLYPPAWVVDRIGVEDDEIQGRRIPKNTIIMAYIFGIHRSETYWNQPNNFNPERFLDGSKHEAYFPFGAGPRLCIGNHFAYLELVIALTSFFQRYSTHSKQQYLPEMKPLVTLQPAEEVWMDIAMI